MPEALAAVLAVPGLGWILTAAFVAGLVRGFAGFGTAMIFLPVAGQILSPFEALTVMVVMDVIGPLPNVPRALREGNPLDVMRLTGALIIGVPIGVSVLAMVDPDVFRYGVSIVALILLSMLIGGVRYTGTVSKPMIYSAGGFGGVLAGCVGLPGPPVIMLYMASRQLPQVIRANTMLYLLAAETVMLSVLALFGHLVWAALGIGLLATVPYLLANVIGAAIFRPEMERVYRVVAYMIIAISALSGLPVFD